MHLLRFGSSNALCLSFTNSITRFGKYSPLILNLIIIVPVVFVFGEKFT